MLDFFQEDSRRPFGLYWLTLIVGTLDIFAGLLWGHILSSFWFYAPSGELPGIVFLHGRWLFSIIFVVCMLLWADLGAGFSFFYIFPVKVWFYVCYSGLFMGVSLIKKDVEIPSYLILWEIFTLITLIIYAVKKNAILRSSRSGKYQVINFDNKFFVFDKTTGKCVEKGRGAVRFHGGKVGAQQDVHKDEVREGDIPFESFDDLVEESLEYTIEDGPEGRIFIVRDIGTGESTIYQSVDQMPPRDYDMFTHVLRQSGLWPKKPKDSSQEN